ncbi:MAG: hypothetical protein RL095_2928 [Verrucomicrobiota bacterium]|jgi:transcriptional antiterminator NusG
MDKRGKWYTVQTLSGKEMKAKESLERRVATENKEMNDFVHEVLVPTEKVVEVRQGRKITVNRKFYPGYIFMHLDLTDDAGKIREDVWHFVKATNGIINFLGGECPVALQDAEIEEMKLKVQAASEDKAAKPKIQFSIGEVVKIKDGAFENFEGAIVALDLDRGKIQVSVTIFGRETPIEVECWQVERVEKEPNT